MAKMHELLAVEVDAQGQFRNIIGETRKDFKDKPALFSGYHRKLVTFDENDKTQYPEEQQAITTTVHDRLQYTAKTIAKYFDVMLQKEATNQVACADLVVDGVMIGEKLPATFLLGLETKLKELRQIYEVIPTLQVGVDWEPAVELGENIFRMKYPEEKLRTEMKFKSQVLYEATKEHPAQIEKWQEQVPTGKFIRNVWSGMISSAEKSRLLGKIDTLLQAVKQARQRANSTEVVKRNIGKEIIDFIHDK